MVPLFVLGCGAATPAGPGAETVLIPSSSAAKGSNPDAPAPSSNNTAVARPEVDEDAHDHDHDPDDPVPGSPWGSHGGPSGGVDCDRAADCCLKILTATTNDPSMLQMCESIRTAPTQACANMLQTFGQAGPGIGVSCP